MSEALYRYQNDTRYHHQVAQVRREVCGRIKLLQPGRGFVKVPTVLELIHNIVTSLILNGAAYVADQSPKQPEHWRILEPSKLREDIDGYFLHDTNAHEKRRLRLALAISLDPRLAENLATTIARSTYDLRLATLDGPTELRDWLSQQHDRDILSESLEGLGVQLVRELQRQPLLVQFPTPGGGITCTWLSVEQYQEEIATESRQLMARLKVEAAK